MNITLTPLEDIFDKLWSDIDSCTTKEIEEKLNKYYDLLVHKDNKNSFKDLKVEEYSMLQAHYDGLQSYIMWLRDLYSGYNSLIGVVGSVQGALHKILQDNGVIAHVKQ